jgi:hypothetical protein
MQSGVQSLPDTCGLPPDTDCSVTFAERAYLCAREKEWASIVGLELANDRGKFIF